MQTNLTAEDYIAALKEFAANPNKEGYAATFALAEQMSPAELMHATEIADALFQQTCERFEKHFRAKEAGKPVNQSRGLQ